jgi:hypothetical protein
MSTNSPELHLVKVNRSIALLKLVNSEKILDDSTRLVLVMAIEELTEFLIEQKKVDSIHPLPNRNEQTETTINALKELSIYEQVNDCLLSWQCLKDSNPQPQEANRLNNLF